MRKLTVMALLCLLSLSVAVVAENGEGTYRPAVLAGEPGTASALALSPIVWRIFPTEVRDSGRVLLFSDNPEYVSEPGIMYRDTVEGKARLYLYHATRGQRVMRYSIVVRNHGERPVNVTITRKGIGGPSSAYPTVGQSALERFWNRLYDERRVVGPGEQAHLDPDLVYLAAPDGSLVHAIYDIETDGPLEIAFVADDDFFRFLEPYLDLYEDMVRPVGERMRGTFPTSERYISLRVGDTPVSFSFAGNQPPDLYLWGTDGVDGSPRQNYGNYGVTYHIDVLMEVTEPRRIRLYLGPEYTNAGTCVLAPALLLTDGAHDDDAESGRVVRLPASSRAVDARFIGETVVLPGEPRVVRFDFMPPGGSCLPALLFADVQAISPEEAKAWYAEHGN